MRIAKRLVPSSRRAASAMVLAGFVLIAPLGGVALADTAGGTVGLGGYGLVANGNGVQMTFDNPAGLGGSHPLGYVGIPEASAKLETGPLGNGMATVIWPGSLFGNLGSATNVLTFLPPSVTGLLKGANDPVRAQANFPGGPSDASYPPGGAAGPVAMTSHADASKVDSAASISGYNLGGVVQVGTVTGHGVTTLVGPADTPTLARADGTSDVGGIDILGGVLHIDSIKSTATASSDGVTGKGTGNTVVAGVTLLKGMVPATIDSTGLHLATTNASLLGLLNPLNALVNQAIKSLNLTAKLISPTAVSRGAQENVNAGAVIITYSVPDNVDALVKTITGKIPQIPNIFDHAIITMALGGATADATAGPGFSGNPAVGPPTGGSTAAPADLGGGGAGAVGSSGNVGLIPTPGASAVVSPAPAPTQVALPASPIGFFGGLKAALVLLALVGGAMMGAGMWKLGTDVLEPRTATVCPLEEGP
ncbi:MAG TPA: choice-of-anchor P family protein [Acidimicrobiales bacterium]|nr:choice-of-anchor P family protein [Acidimicrobiales bacterium]